MTFRELTPEEKAELHDRCPFCKQDAFCEGPQGGLSFNVFCATCLAGYSITHEKLPWHLICAPGEKTVEEIVPLLKRTVTMPSFVEQLSAVIDRALRKAMAAAQWRGKQ